MYILKYIIVRSFSGSHIRIKRCAGLYYHHMIVVHVHVEDMALTVIHYTSGENKSLNLRLHASSATSSFSTKGHAAEVIEEKLKFTRMEISNLEVLEYCKGTTVLSPDRAIRRARMQLGEKKYNLYFANCESFVNWVLIDKKLSAQGEKALIATTTSTVTALGAVSGAGVGAIVGTIAGPPGIALGAGVGGTIGALSAGTVAAVITKLYTKFRRLIM